MIRAIFFVIRLKKCITHFIAIWDLIGKKPTEARILCFSRLTENNTYWHLIVVHRKQRNSELLGHGRYHVCRSFGCDDDENQNLSVTVTDEYGNRQTIVVLRFPQVRPLPPPPPQTSSPRSLSQIHPWQVLHQANTPSSQSRCYRRLATAPHPVRRSLFRSFLLQTTVNRPNSNFWYLLRIFLYTEKKYMYTYIIDT